MFVFKVEAFGSKKVEDRPDFSMVECCVCIQG